MKNFIFILFFLLPTIFFGQNVTTKGVDFWFGFNENILTPTLSIQIASDRNTSGSISSPIPGWSQTFQVAADSVIEVEFPIDVVMAVNSDLSEPKGIHLVANDSVSVSLINTSTKSTDATNILPTHLLGLDHYIFSYSRTIGAGRSQFLIVATEDNTTIQITPTAETTGGQAANIPFNILLEAGEVFQVKSEEGDLTGSSVNASKPVAVYGSHECAIVPGEAWCDHLVEQMYPVSLWGAEFITMPLDTRLNGNTYIIMASEDNTTILLDSTLLINLDAGQFTEQIIEDSKLISSNKPISVGLYSNSQTYDDVSDSDPFLLMLPQVGQGIKKSIFSTIGGDKITAHYINLIVETKNVEKVKLNGVLIPEFFYDPINLTDYSFATLNITEGMYTLESVDSIPFSAYSYGFGNAESYGYVLGDMILPDLLTSSTSLTKEKYELYPNPTRSHSVLKFNNENKLSHNLKIFSIDGKLIREINQINSDRVTIDNTGLPKGLYILQLANEEKIRIIDKLVFE